MRLAKLGTKLKPEHKKKIGDALRGRIGKKHSDETKRKLSLIQIGQKRKPCSPETRLKISLAQRGEKARNWRGGISTENEIARKSVDYKIWRELVFIRDDHTCQECKERGGRLNADHIKPFSTHPKLRFVVGNGRTLCEPCHKKTATYGWKMYNNA